MLDMLFVFHCFVLVKEFGSKKRWFGSLHAAFELPFFFNFISGSCGHESVM